MIMWGQATLFENTHLVCIERRLVERVKSSAALAQAILTLQNVEKLLRPTLLAKRLPGAEAPGDNLVFAEDSSGI